MMKTTQTTRTRPHRGPLAALGSMAAPLALALYFRLAQDSYPLFDEEFFETGKGRP